MTPRTGRPPSHNPKTLNTRIRMSEDDIKMLEFCVDKTGLSKAEVIRQGIKKVYEEVKK